MRKGRNTGESIIFCISVMVVLITACQKPDVKPPDPVPPVVVPGDTTKPLTSATGDCKISKITQTNSDNAKADYAFEIIRDASLTASAVGSFDSLLNKQEYNISIQSKGDTMKLSTGEYFIIDPVTKYVISFYTWADVSDQASDKELYKYEYNTAGYLYKKYCYVNGAAVASYETQYVYDANNLLTGCILYAGSQKGKLLQSTLDYDLSAVRKSWIYLFPDFFEAYRYLQALNFGKRGVYPVKNITTNIYDVNTGAVLDSWITSFSNYVYSSDNFILQTSAKGDLQQGLGLLFGTTRFTYQCTQ